MPWRQNVATRLCVIESVIIVGRLNLGSVPYRTTSPWTTSGYLLRSGDNGIVMPLLRILRHLPPLRMRPLTPRHKEQNHRGYLVWRLLSQGLPVVGELMNLVRMQGRLQSLQLLAEASNIQVGHNSIAGLAANVSRSSQIARSQSDAQTMSRGNAAFAARAAGVGSACR